MPIETLSLFLKLKRVDAERFMDNFLAASAALLIMALLFFFGSLVLVLRAGTWRADPYFRGELIQMSTGTFVSGTLLAVVLFLASNYQFGV